MKLHIYEDTPIISEEYLGEMTSVFKGGDYGVYIAVNPDSNRTGVRYFKYYNASAEQKADSVIRILFDKPGYTVHAGDGKKLWKINHDDKKLLIKILNMKCKKYKGKTYWDAAKFEWNYEYLEEMIGPEEYFNGEYDVLYADNPGYVPSTLEMPDYMKIEVK